MKDSAKVRLIVMLHDAIRTDSIKLIIMETLWTILWIVGVTIALFLFYCGGWWPSTWFRGFLFIILTCLFTPIITFPIQYVIWMIYHGGWGDGDGNTQKSAAFYSSSD